jgi:hypothetical protein
MAAIALTAVATEAAQLPALVGVLGGALILLHLLSMPGFGSWLQTILAIVPLVLAADFLILAERGTCDTSDCSIGDAWLGWALFVGGAIFVGVLIHGTLSGLARILRPNRSACPKDRDPGQSMP